MALTLGPAPCKPGKPCPVVLNPYLDTAPHLQPDKILHQPYWSNMIDRPNAMVSLCSLPKNHHYRIQFYSQRESLGKSVLGKAIIMKELNKDRITSVGKDLTNRSQLYSESIFCLILPGDLPPQNRFFDALLHGCIPLVPLFYESSNALPLPSTHDNPTSFVVTSVPATYPYGRFVQFHGELWQALTG